MSERYSCDLSDLIETRNREMIQILALEHHVQYSVEVRSVYTDEFRFNVFGHKLEY